MLPHPSQPLKNKSKKYLFRHNGELTIIGKEDNYCETVNHNNAKPKYSPTVELDVLSRLIITITIIRIIITILNNNFICESKYMYFSIPVYWRHSNKAKIITVNIK